MPRLGDRSRESIVFLILNDVMRNASCRELAIRVSPEEKNKKSGLESATLISVSNPVSQVLW